jgi:hypothetical protein
MTPTNDTYLFDLLFRDGRGRGRARGHNAEHLQADSPLYMSTLSSAYRTL